MTATAPPRTIREPEANYLLVKDFTRLRVGLPCSPLRSRFACHYYRTWKLIESSVPQSTERFMRTVSVRLIQKMHNVNLSPPKYPFRWLRKLMKWWRDR